MSIVPASRLSASDLARLGNNVGGPVVRSIHHRRKRELVAAVNRSLSIVGEQVNQLHSQPYASLSSASSVIVA